MARRMEMMQRLWMGITPGPLVTRVLVMDGPSETLLQAQLPHGPRHPHALKALCEALALWCDRPVHVVLAVDGPDAFCATRPWLDTFEYLTRRPLVEIEFAEALPAPDEERCFGDIRKLLRATCVR